MKPNINFWSYLAQLSSEWEMFQTKFVDKIKTHVLYSVTFFFRKSAVYRIMWRETVEPSRPQMTVWRMRVECWIPKATNTSTLRISNTHCFSAAKMFARTRLIFTFMIYGLPCLSHRVWENKIINRAVSFNKCCYSKQMSKKIRWME